MIGIPYIPENIIVHLGSPNSNAQNVTVSFPDYIKNVASSEIYPTWPENAIRANILAQISFALNRVYTEFYRSRGYDFDITNNTQYDQAFVNGRSTFENIQRIVDNIFNNYVRRSGSVEPLFTQYCSGTTSTCEGLSQWGTVDLAEDGYTPFGILQHYYGDDIELVTGAPVRVNIPSYPGFPLRLGSAQNEVRYMQVRLNRISDNYPAIPKIEADGFFGAQTEDAVKEFQRIFNLTQDGIVGNATWYRIAYIYNSVLRLSELDSEGVPYEDIQAVFVTSLGMGDTGYEVSVLQYHIRVLADYYDVIPSVEITGTFDQPTYDAVVALQKMFGLTQDGIVGRETWGRIQNAYLGIVREQSVLEGGALYPGLTLLEGSVGDYVTILQENLNAIAAKNPEVPSVTVDGIFGPRTTEAVRAVQRINGMIENGVVGAITWDTISRMSQ